MFFFHAIVHPFFCELDYIIAKKMSQKKLPLSKILLEPFFSFLFDKLLYIHGKQLGSCQDGQLS